MTARPEDILAMVFFARVVEQRSFTGAALRLGVSKSVVSERISALEGELGVRLLHRTTRRLSLTADGLELYERCRPLLGAADEAWATMEGTGSAPRGLLKIDAPIAFAQDYLAAPLAAYLREFPEVRVELTMSDKLIDLVEEGVDVAIRVVPALRPSGLVARRLARDRTVLCASPEYLSRRGTPATPMDLLDHDCLIYSLLKVADEWRFRLPGKKEIQSVSVPCRFSAASGAILRGAALAGMGIAVLPLFMSHEHLRSGRLRQVLPDCFAGVDLGIHAIYPQTRRPPTKVRALIDLLVAHFRTPRWSLGAALSPPAG